MDYRIYFRKYLITYQALGKSVSNIGNMLVF